jgi:hypothetical protein
MLNAEVKAESTSSAFGGAAAFSIYFSIQRASLP